ncbi:hypothetical protein [Geitlerinema calcuttense]|uniref:Uncharacterized protein n=1 Tax=Geitlerinema calcuttense NRMC-F 0142 TaxID=2922238 RepID=A0ABT7LW19_9CYAN|nr:hypothetical protein [Geitlerinema calcuttense]MDL5055934.1 hypothetical protein [Geitlerinema calcuttense NRMC-F 0142]
MPELTDQQRAAMESAFRTHQTRATDERDLAERMYREGLSDAKNEPRGDEMPETNEAMEAAWETFWKGIRVLAESLPTSPLTLDQLKYLSSPSFRGGYEAGYTAAKSETCVWTQDDDIADMPGRWTAPCGLQLWFEDDEVSHVYCSKCGGRVQIPEREER